MWDKIVLVKQTLTTKVNDNALIILENEEKDNANSFKRWGENSEVWTKIIEIISIRIYLQWTNELKQ